MLKRIYCYKYVFVVIITVCLFIYFYRNNFTVGDVLYLFIVECFFIKQAKSLRIK